MSRELPNGTKLLIILATFDSPQGVMSIVERGKYSGDATLAKGNPSTTLARLRGKVIRTPDGWEISEEGRAYLLNLGVPIIGSTARKIAAELRQHLPKIADANVRSYVEEAIACFENKLLRSAVVMSWLAAVAVLYDVVLLHHLEKFNAEAHRIDARWRSASSADDLARMKETDFLDRLASISVIGKNVKEQLKSRLDLRNACGHPNSLALGDSMVMNHIETLNLNVFARFCRTAG